MIAAIFSCFRLLFLLFGGHRAVALENIALRHQLAILSRKVARPRLHQRDRLFWVWLSKVWCHWKTALVIVQPETVVRWQRNRFRRYWRQLSRPKNSGGRPTISSKIRLLVARMAAANPLWGAPRIHGELLKLGIEVSERTVSRLMPRGNQRPSQTWCTFLENHCKELVSIDFFTVPTARMRVLFVLLVLAHHRRRVLHFNVTEHPNAKWTARQMVEAFPEDTVPTYLVRDRDKIYGECFREAMKAMGISEVPTAPHSPWQNPFAERLIGSIRRDCLDHVVVLSENHLRKTLNRYMGYYHRSRTHLSLEKDAPDPRPIQTPEHGRIIEIAEVGGLHHRYERRAA